MVLLIPIAFGVSIICFALITIAPGDPLNAVVASDAPQEVVDKIRTQYGFDRPLVVQYWKWLKRAATGDLGVSVATGRPVVAEISIALANTLLLAMAAFSVCIPLGLLLGGLAGYYADVPIVDKLVSLVAITGVSIPHYWFGLVLVIIFSIELQWLPSMGAPPGGQIWNPASLPYVVLPAVTLAMIPMGVIARTTRATVAEVLSHEFIHGLEAKGLPQHKVLFHVARNAAPTVLAVIGLQFVVLLGGSILVETVFSWPGSGLLLNNAIFQRDMPLLQGTVLVLAFLFISANLAIDIVQTLLDPRIRRH